MKAIPTTVVFAAAAVLAVSIPALAGVWLGSGEKGAAADPATIVGIDMDISGNAANALGIIQDCAEKSPGDKFYIDVFVDEIPAGSTLGRFGYSLEFDDSRLKINTQDHLWLLNLAVGSLVTDESEPVPDMTSPHDVYATDHQGPEAGPVEGVLGRYQLEVLAEASSGLASLSPTYLYLGEPTGTPVPWDDIHLWSGMTAVGVPCPNLTSTPSPSPTPTLMLTLTPTPETPTPNPSPSPTLEVTPTAAPPLTVTPSPPAPEPTPTPAATPLPPPALRCSEPEFERFEAPSFPPQSPRTGKYIEPNTYCGTVTINGQPALDGTLVEAVAEGEVCASVETQDGLYRLVIPLFLCPQDLGNDVAFLVGGREAKEKGQLFSPIYSWSLDLTVGEPTLRVTPTPVRTPAMLPATGGGGLFGGNGLPRAAVRTAAAVGALAAGAWYTRTRCLG